MYELFGLGLVANVNSSCSAMAKLRLEGNRIHVRANLRQVSKMWASAYKNAFHL